MSRPNVHTDIHNILDDHLGVAAIRPIVHQQLTFGLEGLQQVRAVAVLHGFQEFGVLEQRRVGFAPLISLLDVGLNETETENFVKIVFTLT